MELRMTYTPSDVIFVAYTLWVLIIGIALGMLLMFGSEPMSRRRRRKSHWQVRSPVVSKRLDR